MRKKNKQKFSITKIIKFLKSRESIIVSFLVIIGAILRFWNLESYLYFNLDEERDLFIIRKILFDHHPTLIGGSIPGGIYLGPGYFYITSVFAYLTRMDPVGLGLTAAILGTIQIPLTYLVGRKLFSKKVGFIAAALYATSYLVVIYNKIYWPLTFTPLVTLIVYFVLAKIVLDKKIKWILVLFLVLTLGIQSDPATFSLMLLTILSYKLFNIPLKNRYTLYGVCLLFLSHLPLLFFDLRHDFLNFRAILNFFSGNGKNSAGINPGKSLSGITLIFENFARLIYTNKPHDVAQQISPCQVYVDIRKQGTLILTIIISILSVCFFIYNLFVKRQFGLKLITVHLLVVILGVILYNLFFPGYTYEWLFYVTFPSFILVFSYFLASINFKPFNFMIYLGLILLIFINVKAVLNGGNSFGLQQKKEASRYALGQVNGRPYSLDSIGACFALGGYRYVYWLLGSQPNRSYMDYLYSGWLYPDSWLKDDFGDLVVVMVNPDFFPPGGEENQKYFAYLKKYKQYKNHLISSKKFGRTEVLIVDNRDKWINF